MTLLVCLLRRASASEAPMDPVVFAVSVGAVPVFGTVMIVVQPVVGSLLVCSVGVGCALLVARPSLAGLQPRSSLQKAHRFLC